MEKDFFNDLPVPPERIPDWASKQAAEWRRLDDFDLLSKAEEYTGLQLEICYESLPIGVWGIYLVRGKRGKVFVNAMLPLVWRRFAIFHELYHLLNHRKGAKFWTHTCEPMESFENRADIFAWAALWPEWTEGDYANWA